MLPISLDIEPSFFKKEVKCDFLVTEKTKKIWAIELDLLNELLRVCKKNDIKVYAFAGTLLGAVRHKGFIPWDDDVDVCLLREDFEKLIRIASQEFSSPYFFQTDLSDRKFFCGYARLRNSETTGMIVWNRSIEYNNGIYIDVFVMDGYTKNKLKLNVQLKQMHLMQKMIELYYKDLKDTSHIKRMVYKPLQGILHLVLSYESLIKIYNKIIVRYNDTSDSVSLLTHGMQFITKYWCKQNDLRETVCMPFECIEIPVPKNYDKIMKNMYGDYMKFPAVEDRGTWHDNIIIFDPDVPYKQFLENMDKK